MGGVAPAPDGAAGANARKAWLKQRIDALIADTKRVRRAKVGVVVRDLVSGDVLYATGADAGYNVASNTKIVTEAAALSLLGPGFRYRTTFAAGKVEPGGVIDELYVRGQGDPFLGTAELLEIVGRLQLHGIKKIKGGITLDDTYFDDTFTPPHFDEQPKVQAAWRPPVSALSLDGNTVTVSIRANKAPAAKPTIRLFPPNRYIRIVNKVDVVETGRTNVRLDVKVTRRSTQMTFSGRMRRSQPQRYKYRVANPRMYFGAALRRMLRQHGISVGRRSLHAHKLPRRVRTLVVRKSPTLAVLLRGMGKYSNNYVAETILKTIGAHVNKGRHPATWNDGVHAVRSFLIDKLGFKRGSFRYDNGSGLFDSNRFSPRQLVRVLSAAYSDFRYGPDLAATMATAATDGTLRKRMRHTLAAGRVRAKTGTLAHASALSGYAGKSSQHQLAFSIVFNDMHRGALTRRDARLLQDHIAAALVAYLPDK